MNEKITVTSLETGILKNNIILRIDDDIENSTLRPYVDELNEQGFTIIGANNPDKVEALIEKYQKQIKLIIIDDVMPTGENISYGESRGGMQTGLVVLKNLMENLTLGHIPKIMFVGGDNENIKEYCEKNTVPYRKKINYLTDAFATDIKNIILNQ